MPDNYDIYFISRDNLNRLWEKLVIEFNLYFLQDFEGQLFYQLIDSPERLRNSPPPVYDRFRSVISMKAFFFLPRQKVGGYFSPESSSLSPVSRPRMIVGLKACDLIALRTLDQVFLEEATEEPLYRIYRENTFLISSDCTDSLEVCFCTLLGYHPYPDQRFDWNLSPLKEGFLVEVGSLQGAKLLNSYQPFFRNFSPDQITSREENRQLIQNQVMQRNRDFFISRPYHEVIKANFESRVWEEKSQECIECIACIHTCPTCYCFFLSDQRLFMEYQRFQNWDACYYAGFARVAGGANPRALMVERWRHRYVHKFDYYRDRYGWDACSGCGRCIAVCPAKIDMRDTIKRLSQEHSLTGVRK